MIIDEQNNIKIVRGDTAEITVALETSGGEAYVFTENDHLKFGVKRSPFDSALVIEKDIPTDTCKLVLDSESTANLEFGDYQYDIRLYSVDSETGAVAVSTPIAGKFSIGYNVLPSEFDVPEEEDSDDTDDNANDNENDNENV